MELVQEGKKEQQPKKQWRLLRVRWSRAPRTALPWAEQCQSPSTRRRRPRAGEQQVASGDTPRERNRQIGLHKADTVKPRNPSRTLAPLKAIPEPSGHNSQKGQEDLPVRSQCTFVRLGSSPVRRRTFAVRAVGGKHYTVGGDVPRSIPTYPQVASTEKKTLCCEFRHDPSAVDAHTTSSLVYSYRQMRGKLPNTVSRYPKTFR